MKRLMLLIMLFLINFIYSQNKKSLHIVSITNTCKLGFNTYNKEFKMYQKPFILVGKKKYKIQGYDSENYSGGNVLSISPNKKYIVLDHISKGYVDDGVNKTLYENYLCVIIEIKKRKVVMEMQEDCGGNWNEKDQWVYDNEVKFNGN